MSSEDKPPTAEREKTDESLRVEREKADNVGWDNPSAIDDTADAVIERARGRADAVLAVARAKSDRASRIRAHGEGSLKSVDRERRLEDQAIRRERAEADTTLHVERADREARLALEREETNKDLSVERTQSDDAVATRDEFLGIVSHDLRSMLVAVVGFAALIAKEASLDNRREAVLVYAQRIQRSGARMNRLIGDLVDVASIDAGRLAVTRAVGDPCPVVAEAVETFQAQALASRIGLVAEVVPPLPMVAFDAARILQVLSNLLSNALKFIPPDGRVVVQVERLEREIRFAVRDTGEGIQSDKLEAIFERFLQVTKDDRRGLGLGLYISKSIVQGHRGRIWAESTLGGGSTFCFTLPV